MKKYIRCKNGANETKNQKALEIATGSDYTPSLIPKVVKEEKQNIPAINPPLPLDPPPPDNPPEPRPMLTVKEKKDILKNPDDPDSHFNPERLLKNIKTEHVADDPPKSKKPTVCRDFIRGTCSRPTTCKYAHVKDLDQLQKVYTFCHNFQNSECKYPNCKYVHATISEEQQFYRTAVLPPHTIAHHKNKSTPKFAPPPPPPPPEIKVSPTLPVDMNTFAPVNSNAINSSVEKLPAASLPAAAVIASNSNGTHNFVNNAPSKLTWNGHDNCVGSPRAMDMEKHAKCDNCVLMGNRLLHTNNKVENMKKSISACNEKLANLDMKEKRLNAVLKFLMQPKTNQQGELQASNGPVKDIRDSLNRPPPRPL